MTVIFSSNPILIGPEANLTLDHPIIGWQNILTASGVTADSSNPNYPASNLANPATHLTWKAAVAPTSYQYITIAAPATALDYVAIARHNLGTQAIPITVGYFDLSSPPIWVDLSPEIILADDGPALFRFSEQSLLTDLKIRLGLSANIPEIAVIYAGKLLVLPRKLYQGFVPIPYGLIAKVTNGRSEAGNFLGRIVLQEFVKDTVPLSLIDPAYFRNHIAEFLIDSKENPFFIAWRPETYPDEVGYCHMTNDPAPVNEAPHGLIAMQLEMTGII